MAITSERLIYNKACDKVGEYYVSDDTSTSSKQYVLCERNYDDARDEVLVEHPWNEAKKRVCIAQESDHPIFGYERKFAKPSDCLRVLSVNDSSGADVSLNYAGIYPWEVEGGYILTDAGENPQSWVTSTAYYVGEFVYDADNEITYEVLVSHTSDTIANDVTAGNLVSAGGDYKVIYVEYIYQLTTVASFSPKLKNAIALKLAIKIVAALINNPKAKQALIEEYERLVLPKARSVDAMQGKPKPIFNSSWLRARQES